MFYNKKNKNNFRIKATLPPIRMANVSQARSGLTAMLC